MLYKENKNLIQNKEEKYGFEQEHQNKLFYTKPYVKLTLSWKKLLGGVALS